MIQTIASSAALAIRNQRLIDAVVSVDREIISQAWRTRLTAHRYTDDAPDRKIIGAFRSDPAEMLFGLIVERAVAVTCAGVGEVRFLDPQRGRLVIQAKYPSDVQCDELEDPKSLDEGITGWVVRERQPALVADTQQNPNYKGYFVGMRSELCVPLIDPDGRVIGILNVESSVPAAFDERDLRRLEVLAQLAVIAHGVERLVERQQQDELINTVDTLGTDFKHQVSNLLDVMRYQREAGAGPRHCNLVAQ